MLNWRDFCKPVDTVSDSQIFCRVQVRPLDFGQAHLLLQPETNRQLVEICEKELYLAIQYVKRCPFIGELPLDDQVALIKCGKHPSLKGDYLHDHAL